MWQIAYKWPNTKYLDAEEVWGYVWQNGVFIAERERVDIDIQIRSSVEQHNNINP
jgi:hypothetical protein